MTAMKLELTIDADQSDAIFVHIAKERYELLVQDKIKWANEPLIDETLEAYKLILQDSMTEKDFKTYMHSFAKKAKKYDAKRLTDAENGL